MSRQLPLAIGKIGKAGITHARFSILSFSPVLWLDAADLSTITQSAGSVSQWDDKSGNGYHATQGVGASQPATGATSVNGLNVIDFNFKFMNLNGGILPYVMSDLTIFGVFLVGGSGTNLFMGGKDGSGNVTFKMSLSGSPIAQQFQAGTKNTYTTTNVPNDANAHVHMLVRDETAATIAGYADNVLCREVSANADSAITDAYLGSVNGAASIQGSIAEIIALPKVADSNARSKIHNYLNVKWGIS